MSDPVLVHNAADPVQVAVGESFAKRHERERVELVARQLSTNYGRQFVWEEIERRRVYDKVSGPSDEVYLFLGRRETGIELLEEVMHQHAQAFLVMQAEALARRQQQQRDLGDARKQRRKVEEPDT